MEKVVNKLSPMILFLFYFSFLVSMVKLILLANVLWGSFNFCMYGINFSCNSLAMSHRIYINFSLKIRPSLIVFYIHSFISCVFLIDFYSICQYNCVDRKVSNTISIYFSLTWHHIFKRVILNTPTILCFSPRVKLKLLEKQKTSLPT